MKATKRNIFFFILPLFTGFIAYIITRDNIDIYESLIKPPLSPPPAVFVIAWTILYLLMGISSIMIINRKSTYRKPAINIYLFSLIFNFVWSPIFFNRRQFMLSLLIIVILWLLVYATIRIYSLIDKKAAFLQIPYFIWLIYAFYLNAAIIVLN